MICDIVIPYQLNSKGYELKYALRSIEKHLSGVGQVFIVGDVPEWTTNIIHLPFEQTRGNIKWKERNIYEKVLAACNDERVSERFLFMNDDHFLCSDYEAGEFPYYWHATLGISEQKRYGDYKETLRNTLGITGQRMQDHDCHCPTLYSKYGFKKLSQLDWKQHFGYAIKTMYAFFNNLEGEQTEDLKIKEQLCFQQLLKIVETRDWFSINDRALNDGMKILLKYLYPKKSKFEL